MLNSIMNSKRRYDHTLVQKSKNKVNYCMNPSGTHCQHESSDFNDVNKIFRHGESNCWLKMQIQSFIGSEIKE